MFISPVYYNFDSDYVWDDASYSYTSDGTTVQSGTAPTKGFGFITTFSYKQGGALIQYNKNGGLTVTPTAILRTISSVSVGSHDTIKSQSWPYIVVYSNTNNQCVGMSVSDFIDSAGGSSVSVNLTTSNPIRHGTRCTTAIQIGNILINADGVDIDNPYNDDDNSGTGGGDGDGTPTDDDTQPDDGVPSISITNTGLISLYAPSLSELQSFGNYLWSDAFSLDTFKKLFSDPMDAILGMSIVPLNLSGVTSSLIIGNVDTGLSAPKLSQQYYTVDCGSFTVQPDINSYLDYSPYTRFSVFLPYIGFQTLDADDIMGQTLNIKYKVDVLTTALICEIRVDDHLRYSFSGTCGTSIPITAQNWGSMIQSVVSSATTLVGLAVGAAAAPVTGGASLGLSAVGAAGSIAGNSLSMKPDIQKGGNLGGSPGFMGWQIPFLIRYTPRRVNSKSQQTYTGYPSLITSKLSEVHGYTEIQSINLSVSGATDSECVEIDRQLKQGVILP